MKRLILLFIASISLASCERCIECNHDYYGTVDLCKSDMEPQWTVQDYIDSYEQQGYECNPYYD